MALYALLPVHFQELGLTAFQVGILLSANRWIRLVTNHLAEKIIGKWNKNVTLLSAFLIGPLLALVYGTTPVFVWFLLARLGWGFCWSLIRQIGIMTAVDLAEKDSIGRSIGLFNGILRIGSMIGILLAGLLFDLGGFRFALFSAAGISLMAVPFGYSGLKRTGTVFKETIHQKIKGRDSGIIISLFHGFIVGCIGRGIMMSTLGYILKQQTGDTVHIGSLIIGIATVNGIMLAAKDILNSLLSPFLGAVSDRVGYRKSLTIFFGLGSGALMVSALTSSLSLILVCILLFYISDTTLVISLSAVAGKMGSRSYATFATGFDLGGAVGPILSWSLVGLMSSSVPSLTFGAILYTLGFVSSLIWRNGRKICNH
jgi:MFS family permease